METKEILKKAKDEGISALGMTVGVAGGVTLIKFAKTYVSNPWALPAGAFLAGLLGKVFSNNATLKDISTGIMLVGVADGAKKGIEYAIEKIPALAPLAQVSQALPTLSGPDSSAMYPIVPQSLRGGYEDANVVSSLRGR